MSDQVRPIDRPGRIRCQRCGHISPDEDPTRDRFGVHCLGALSPTEPCECVTSIAPIPAGSPSGGES